MTDFSTDRTPAALSPADVAPPHIRRLPSHPKGSPAPEAAAVCQMASNENPLGASPLALAALARAMDQASVYPDAQGLALKQALQRRFGIAPDRLLLGNGSSELIDLVARSFLRPGDEAVLSQYAFIAYPLAIKLADAAAVQVPALDFGHDLDAMRAAITDRTRLVFVANPNNPTGTRLDEAALRRFLAQVPPHVVVLLDEAYTEYQAPAQRLDSFTLVDRHANLIVTRSFSKAYGLAGLRLGYAVAQPPLIELLDRVRPVFNVNAPAQAAGAAALFDDDFLQRTLDTNREGLALLQREFARLGLRCIPSWGNFLAVDFAGQALPAAELARRLLQAGFAVRPLAAYGLPGHLRVTVGTPAQNRAFIAALEAVLGAVRA
jgi:histidinol-phosphate aminotransferase